MIRGIIKRAVEATVVRSSVTKRLGRRFRGRKLILAYHNILPEGQKPWGEQALHLPSSRFKEHLEVLSDTCDIVPLHSLLDGSPGPETRAQAAITFDDAYRGALHAANEVLRPLGIPASFFTPPGLLGQEGFWWDQVATGFGGALPARVRRHCLHSLSGGRNDILAWARSEGLSIPRAPDHARPSTETEVKDAAKMEGVFIESHTWSHKNLSALSRSGSEVELDRARRWIQERSLGTADFVAYPYGFASPQVEAIAQETGHRRGLLVQGGWIPSDGLETSPFAIPRLNVPAGLTSSGLRMRLAGLRLR